MGILTGIRAEAFPVAGIKRYGLDWLIDQPDIRAGRGHALMRQRVGYPVLERLPEIIVADAHVKFPLLREIDVVMGIDAPGLIFFQRAGERRKRRQNPIHGIEDVDRVELRKRRGRRDYRRPIAPLDLIEPEVVVIRADQNVMNQAAGVESA